MSLFERREPFESLHPIEMLFAPQLYHGELPDHPPSVRSTVYPEKEEVIEIKEPKIEDTQKKNSRRASTKGSKRHNKV